MSEQAKQTLGPGLLVSVADGCATLTLNRPERHNSLSQEDMVALRDALVELDKDQNLRVLVLTGAGEKSFCSGAFLNEVADRSFKGNPFEDLTDTLENFRLPTICALNGSVYGGGGEVSLCCDFRIGVEGMRMFVPPARLGIHYPEKGLTRFITRVGLGAAKRILLAVETFDANALLQMGFIDYLVPRDQLAARTQTLARDLAALAPLSVQFMKRSLNELARGEVDSDAIKGRIAQCWNSQDHKEAVRAMAEKRTPVFQQK
ncbi:MAG: enoyl-CoA hydratase-related protein [Alphaproteobacteria bacterium]|nr:enoyl-CoA hydratase-related protein [Alphaproteobacteria bacterium]